MTQLVDKKVLEESQIPQLCIETVGSNQIFAACFHGPGKGGFNNEKTDIHILLILHDYMPKIRNLTRETKGANLYILAIDKKVFEADVEKGKLGELAAEILTLPYQPWINPKYLEEMEVKIKKRFVIELLKNIVMQYPELSTELLIKPEYFMFEVLRRRTKLFSPSIYGLLYIFDSNAKGQNIKIIMKGFFRALKELEEEGFVEASDGFVKINRGFIESTRQQRTKFSTIVMSIQKALLSYFRGVSSRTAWTLQYSKSFREDPSQKAERNVRSQLDETEKFLMMPTPLGPVPLSDKTNIQEFVRKTVPGGEAMNMTIEEMGGVLNSVFLLQLQRDYGTQKIVVKKFEDWFGFKWFPLALWALGTHSFAVLGETRLEREYSISQFLKKHGIKVPQILYVSPKERLIFKDFVEGEKLSETIRRIVNSPKREGEMQETQIIKTVGKEIAKAHMLGVSFGDCKPENMLITEDGKICFLDLEQAERNGNKPWDIAEFLYYAGHYFSPIHSDETARIIASSFVEGYLEAGGEKATVRKAASPKYTKVFTIFTLPNIIWIMANVCRKMGKEKT